MEYYGITKGIAVSNRTISEAQLHRLEILKHAGYNIDLFLSKSIYDSYSELSPWPDENRSLKKYQVESLSELQKSFLRGDKCGLICLATGLGKTFVAASFLRWLYELYPNLNVLVLANSKSPN